MYQINTIFVFHGLKRRWNGICVEWLRKEMAGMAETSHSWAAVKRVAAANVLKRRVCGNYRMVRGGLQSPKGGCANIKYCTAEGQEIW